MTQSQDIISKWIKIDPSSCNEKYPDILQFMENGVYNGSKGDNKSKFTIWDVGSYEILSVNEIKLSTATDKEIVYNFSIIGNSLEFSDENNCKIRYRRTP